MLIRRALVALAAFAAVASVPEERDKKVGGE